MKYMQSPEPIARLKEQGYLLEQIGRAVKIDLPALLPKREKSCAFLLNPLHELLSLYVRTIPRFEQCTVIFQHLYQQDRPPADVRDHDNVETRVILNAIERYLLTSDSGYYCANIQMTAFAPTDKTVIWILPGQPDLSLLCKAVTG